MIFTLRVLYIRLRYIVLTKNKFISLLCVFVFSNISSLSCGVLTPFHTTRAETRVSLEAVHFHGKAPFEQWCVDTSVLATLLGGAAQLSENPLPPAPHTS